MNKSISIKEVILVDGKPRILGSVGETQFTAGLLQWGSKVLIKVEGNDLDRGLRIAIGHAAKKALRTMSISLEPAPLKRPRKAAEVSATFDIKVPMNFGPASIEPLNLVVDPTPVVDLTKLTVLQLKARAKSLGLKGYSDMNKPQLLVLLG